MRSRHRRSHHDRRHHAFGEQLLGLSVPVRDALLVGTEQHLLQRRALRRGIGGAGGGETQRDTMLAPDFPAGRAAEVLRLPPSRDRRAATAAIGRVSM